MENQAPSNVMSEQEYVLAGGKPSTLSDTPAIAMVPEKKRGHKCCGGCCDVRRATIIVNLANIGLLLLGLWAIAAIAVSNNQQAADDDEMGQVTAEREEFSGMGIVITIMVVRLICNVCGVYGAFTYNVALVGISLASYVLEALLAIIGFSVAGLLMAVFFAYPHFMLIREVRSGIMSKDTYPIEQQSCCCV